MVQMIKSEEHLVVCLSEGVQKLVQTFNCKGLVHGLVREITEWQTDEKFQDSQEKCLRNVDIRTINNLDFLSPQQKSSS